MDAIYVTDAQGQRQGPYVPDQLQALYQSGAVPPGAYYWKEGMADWRPLLELPGIAPLPHLQPGATRYDYAAALTGGHAFTHDPSRITRALVVMLRVYLVLSVLNFVGELWQGIAMGSGSYTQDVINAVEIYQSVLGVGGFLFYIATAVVFGRWIYRAGVNVRGFGAQGMENSPGWAVGWYFIPFANLYKPFQAMSEIWRASVNPRAWQHLDPPNLLRGWWGLWLVSNWLGQIAFRLSTSAASSGGPAGALYVSMVSSLIDVPLCLAAIKVVEGVYRNQEAWVAQGDAAATSEVRPAWA